MRSSPSATSRKAAAAARRSSSSSRTWTAGSHALAVKSQSLCATRPGSVKLSCALRTGAIVPAAPAGGEGLEDIARTI